MAFRDKHREEDDYEEEEEESAPRKSVQIALYEPRTFEEAAAIADHLKAKEPAVVNMHRMDKVSEQRMIDFLTGNVYAMNGKVQMVGQNTILCTPSADESYGEISLNDD